MYRDELTFSLVQVGRVSMDCGNHVIFAATTALMMESATTLADGHGKRLCNLILLFDEEMVKWSYGWMD